MRFVLDRDTTDHMRFSPLQTDIAKKLCSQYAMPSDVSTGVLIDEEGGHKESAAILRIFPYMGFPYSFIGALGFCVPRFIRDYAYRTFAKHRGAIWKRIKRIAGLGDTYLEEHRDRILGLEEPLDPSWGFASKTVSSKL